MPHAASLNPGTGSFTLSLWVNPNAIGGIQRISWKNNGSTFNGYYLALIDSTFFYGIGDGAVKVEPSGGAAVAGSWYLVTGVRDVAAGKVRLYVNDVLVRELADTTTNISHPEDLSIGGRFGIEGFAGKIDEVHIYNHVLSTNEVSALYSIAQGLAGLWRFDEGSGSGAIDGAKRPFGR